MKKPKRPTAKERALTKELETLKTGANSINQQSQIEALSKELDQTKRRLSSIEKEITDFLDREQREVAAICHVTNVEYAIQHLKFLHQNRDLIEEVMNAKLRS